VPDYFTKSVFLEGHGEPGSIRIVKMGPGMVWPTCTDCINTTSHESVLVAYNFGLATSCDLDFNCNSALQQLENSVCGIILLLHDFERSLRQEVVFISGGIMNSIVAHVCRRTDIFISLNSSNNS